MAPMAPATNGARSCGCARRHAPGHPGDASSQPLSKEEIGESSRSFASTRRMRISSLLGRLRYLASTSRCRANVAFRSFPGGTSCVRVSKSGSP